LLGVLKVDVSNGTSEVDFTNYVPNGEWELLEALLIRNVTAAALNRFPT
jgi:hypothetical protein